MKNLILSLLLACPLFLTASQNQPFDETETRLLNPSLGCHVCKEASGLKLANFQGHYRAHFTSLGGVAGPSTTGSSLSAIAQFSIDRAGVGTINYLSSSTYTGPIGEGLTVYSTNTGFPVINFTLTITDSLHGAGTIVIQDYPVVGSNLLGDFVATRKKDSVESFIINATGFGGNSPAALSNALLIFCERQ